MEVVYKSLRKLSDHQIAKTKGKEPPWSGYPTEIQLIERPAWAKRKDLE